MDQDLAPTQGGSPISFAAVIPAYNASSTIEDALESVRRQTLPVNEVVIVDDGSTDGTPHILRNYIAFHSLAPRWRLVEQGNKGPGAARDRGIKASTSDYVALLDADDVWLEHKLERVADVLRTHEIDLLGALFGPPVAAPLTATAVQPVSLRRLLFSNYFFTSTVAIRRSVYLRSSGFDPLQRHSEDYRLWLELAACGYRCCLLPEAHALYAPRSREAATRLSKNHRQMEISELSNLSWLFRQGWIGRTALVLASAWSIAKYLRRLIRSGA